MNNVVNHEKIFFYLGRIDGGLESFKVLIDTEEQMTAINIILDTLEEFTEIVRDEINED